jgi:hypothetical protein
MKKNINNNNCPSNYVHPACTTTTTKKECCIECVHPIEYIFDAALDLNNINTLVFENAFISILDRGYVSQNCNICCANCDNLYFLGSIDASIDLYDALNYLQEAAIPPSIPVSTNYFGDNDLNICCSNVTASVDEYLQYAENVGLTLSEAVLATNQFLIDNVKVKACCNGFTDYSKDFIAWVANGNFNTLNAVLAKGIVEHGEVINNCNNKTINGIDILLQKIKQVQLKEPSFFSNTNKRLAFFNDVFDRGIVAYCNELGDVSIGSVETWIKYAEPMGYIPDSAVPPA